jgi:sugar lactone lactonase YvrE
MPIGGGTPSSFVAFSEKDFWGASWGEDDNVVFAVGRSGLKTVSVRDGKSTVLTELNKSRAEGSHRLPHHVAGHKVLLFTVLIEGTFGNEIWAVDLSTGERKYLLDGSKASYLSSGHILVSRPESLYRGSLWLAPFDVDRIEVTGPLEQIEVSTGSQFGRGWTVAPNGVMVYQPSQGDLRASLVLLEPGGEARVISESRGFEGPRFSHDGKKVAVTRMADSRQLEIRIYDLESGANYQLAERGYFPLWDPDDRGITYSEMTVGIVHQRLDDPESKEILVLHPQVIGAGGWINDGKSLVYNEVNPETGTEAHVLHADGGRERIYGQGAVVGSVTPDDLWLALCTWPRGILVGKLPGFTSISNPSTQGCFPKWSSDGSHLFYQDYDRLWTVETKPTKSGVAFGARNVVTELAPGRVGQYDIDKSGRLILVRSQFENPSPPVLLLNWFNPHAADHEP